MRILLVEDERKLAAQVQQALSAAAFVVDVAHEGEDAALLGEAQPYDAVVLDLGLPGHDGLTVLRGWRRRGMRMPVLILTARSDWHSRVEGLNAGADDYLGKPFVMEELIARLHALIRRSEGFAAPEITCGPISLDAAAAKVAVNGKPVVLTAQEFRTLRFLMRRQGRIVSQQEICEHIYDLADEHESNTVEVFIARIRRKLGVDAIKTVRGLGYRLQAP